MPNAFLRHLEHWLPTTLRTKAIQSEHDTHLHFIGASDLATLFSDYVLTELSTTPTSCWTACELDHVSDEQLVEAICCPPELLAAGFVGAVVELALWQGDEGVAFLVAHGVPSDDAREFSAAVDVVAEKLGARGRTLIHALAPEVAPHFSVTPA